MRDPAHARRMHPAWTVRRMDLRPGRSRQARRCPRPGHVRGFAGAACARQIRAAARCRPTWKARPVKYCRGLGGIFPAVIATGAADPRAHLPGHNISSADTPEARLRQFFPNRTAHASHMLAPKRPGGFTLGPVRKPQRRRRATNLVAFATPYVALGRHVKGAPSRHIAGAYTLSLPRDSGAFHSHNRKARAAVRVLRTPWPSRPWPISRPARRRGVISFVALWVWLAASCAHPPPSPRSSLR